MTASTIAEPDAVESRCSNHVALLGLAAAGGAVATALGVYGRVHTPTGGQIADLGFQTMKAMKSFLANVAMGVVVVQIASALAMFGRLPLLTTTPKPRPLVHGLFGCAFYGAMTTKLLALRSKRLPRWAIPVFGSLLVLTLTVAWLTSALWFYTAFDITR